MAAVQTQIPVSARTVSEMNHKLTKCAHPEPFVIYLP
jgi:hypothetical protein